MIRPRCFIVRVGRFRISFSFRLDGTLEGGIMGFWESVNDELKRAVEEGWTAVRESARTGKLRLRIHNLHREAERRFKEIGGIVYESAKLPWENPLQKPEVQKAVEEIKKIEAETEALREEIEKLKHKETSRK